MKYAVALLITIAACSTPGVIHSMDPLDNAIQQASMTLQSAIERGHETTESLESVRFSCRYNPTDCDCPPWEIVYHGQWTRVFLNARPEHHVTLERLSMQALSDHGAGLYELYEVVGDLSEDLTLVETGIRYRSLWLSE